MLRDLKTQQDYPLPQLGEPSGIDYSPDRSRLLWSQGYEEERTLLILDIANTKVIQLGSADANWMLGAFSPTGMHIIYGETTPNQEAGILVMLYIADTDGTDARLFRENALPLTCGYR